MVCNTLREAATLIAEDMATKRASVVSVDVTPEIAREGSVFHEVCEADPRLILCIKNLQIQVENYGMWAKLILHVEYTENLCATVVKIERISELRETAVYSAGLHRRNLLVVYPIHMHEAIQNEMRQLLDNRQMLNYFVTGFTSETKQVVNCKYMAQIIYLQYSCSYREWVERKQEMAEKTDEIVRYAKLNGIEDWRKAYAVVRYCVENWRYGRVGAQKLEYTAYSAIVKNTAVCMGISLAVCSIFKELGIPCRYVRGKRNGEGHAWNMVFIRGGWFYIDVTDSICRKDPLYQWGMVQLQDRIVRELPSEPLSCNCSPEFIRKMTCR